MSQWMLESYLCHEVSLWDGSTPDESVPSWRLLATNPFDVNKFTALSFGDVWISVPLYRFMTNWRMTKLWEVVKSTTHNRFITTTRNETLSNAPPTTSPLSYNATIWIVSPWQASFPFRCTHQARHSIVFRWGQMILRYQWAQSSKVRLWWTCHWNA